MAGSNRLFADRVRVYARARHIVQCGGHLFYMLTLFALWSSLGVYSVSLSLSLVLEGFRVP